MTVLDSLAPCPPGRWTHDHVTVERVPSGPIRLRRTTDGLHVTHALTPDAAQRTPRRRRDRIDPGRRVRTERIRVDDGRSRPLDRPRTLSSRGSPTTATRLNELLDGTAEFAPIHDKAAELGHAGRVLDLGFVLRVPAAAARRRGLRRDRHRHPPRHDATARRGRTPISASRWTPSSATRPECPSPTTARTPSPRSTCSSTSTTRRAPPFSPKRCASRVHAW